jgi:hypothetical protein
MAPRTPAEPSRPGITGVRHCADTGPMQPGWRERERDGLAVERRLLIWLCAAFGALAVGGFVVASLTALVLGAIGATFVIGRMRSLPAAERLLSRR